MERIIIYIENDTVSAFNVKKDEPIRPKGLDSMKLDSKESVSNFCKILRDKYNIDDFSDIDMSICLVNEGADEEKLTALREELQNAYNYCENTVENTVELKRNIDKQNVELINENAKLKSQLESSMKENVVSKEKLSELEIQLQELNKFKEDVTKAIEKKLEQKKSIQEKRERQDCIHKIDFIHDSQWNDNNKFSPHTSEQVYFHRKLQNGKKVSYGQIIGAYNRDKDIFSTGMFNLGPMIGAYNRDKDTSTFSVSGRCMMAKTNGILYYLTDENKAVGHGDIVAVIGNFNSLEKAKAYLKNNNLF